MRVVLDTNILVSALISPHGATNFLYKFWQSGRYILVSSEEQLEEFRRVTRYPKVRQYITPSAAGTMLNELRELSVLAQNLPILQISRDPADNFLLSMSEAGKAHYLITGDKRDVLKLRHYKSTKILSVRRFLDVLK